MYELFLFINGSAGILLIGAAVGTFFTGSNFELSDYNFVTWTHPFRGLEAALSFSLSSVFNIALGLFLVFNARTLGSMYLINNIDLSAVPEMEERLRKACWTNFTLSLPFCLYVVVSLLVMKGFGIVDDQGTIDYVKFKYFTNLLANPWLLGFLLGGLGLVIIGALRTAKTKSTAGIWFGGLGTVLVGLTVLLLPAYNNTAFYPSKFDLQSSLTIYNASSSPYTLKVMTYVALGIPFVLAYIVYVWWAMDRKKIKIEDTGDSAAY